MEASASWAAVSDALSASAVCVLTLFRKAELGDLEESYVSSYTNAGLLVFITVSNSY